MRYTGKVPLGTTVPFSENRNNFIFLILRIICNPISGNLDSGSDCQDIIIPSNREGYYYGNAFTGKICISINHNLVQVGASPEDNQFCPYGFAIYGIMAR